MTTSAPVREVVNIPVVRPRVEPKRLPTREPVIPAWVPRVTEVPVRVRRQCKNR